MAAGAFGVEMIVFLSRVTCFSANLDGLVKSFCNGRIRKKRGTFYESVLLAAIVVGMLLVRQPPYFLQQIALPFKDIPDDLFTVFFMDVQKSYAGLIECPLFVEAGGQQDT